METRQPTILCISSYFKGNKFLETCKKAGWKVILVTRESLLGEPWARQYCDEVFGLPSLFERDMAIRAISYIARTREIDRIAPLDDYDVEMAATLREHMRIPGMGETTSHYFRDKLAMRERCHARGVNVPEFVHVLNDGRIREFLGRVPGPWLIKPRSAANSFGIRKFEQAGPLLAYIEELGDDRTKWLIERYLPGDVCHVDAITYEGRVVFAEAHKYRRPLMDVAKGGGIFATRTVERGSKEERELLEMHREVVGHFGLRHGVTHMEFIRANADGKLYFLETAARVGGAHIYDLVEATTGVSLWSEWAKLELSQGETPYAVPEHKALYGGLILALARQETPDTSQFSDPEVAKRIDLKNHIGLVVTSTSRERVEQLLESYEPRIARDYVAVLPEAPPTH
jgi:biotin carboxylase